MYSSRVLRFQFNNEFILWCSLNDLWSFISLAFVITFLWQFYAANVYVVLTPIRFRFVEIRVSKSPTKWPKQWKTYATSLCEKQQKNPNVDKMQCASLLMLLTVHVAHFVIVIEMYMSLFCYCCAFCFFFFFFSSGCLWFLLFIREIVYK